MAECFDIERVRKAIDWLVYDGVVKSRRDLADKLGYTESALSQILNGKVRLSGLFIKKLSKFDDRLDPNWFSKESSWMLKDNKNPLNQITEQTLGQLSEEAFLTTLMQMYADGKIYPAAVFDKIIGEKNDEIAKRDKIIEDLKKEVWLLEQQVRK